VSLRKSVEEAILELGEKSGAENNVDSGVLEGRNPLFLNHSPFPLVRGRGLKGDRVTQ